MKYAIIVPARIGSQRLPRKMLCPILGKPLIRWTADKIRGQVPDIPLFFATDDDEIERVLKEGGYEVFQTSPHCRSGTDRVAEVNERIQADYVINVQGDEPMIMMEQIAMLMGLIPACLQTCGNV